MSKPTIKSKLYAAVYRSEDWETKGDILDVDGLIYEIDSSDRNSDVTKVEFFESTNIDNIDFANKEEMKGWGVEPGKYEQFEATDGNPYYVEVKEVEILELDDDFSVELDKMNNAWTNLNQLAEAVFEQGKEYGGEQRIFLPYNRLNKIDEEE